MVDLTRGQAAYQEPSNRFGSNNVLRLTSQGCACLLTSKVHEDRPVDADGDVGRRGRRAAGQDPAKRRQIIEGARRVFIEMGFDAASMNDITRDAGVSKGTIYVYFANKEELFEALIEDERRTIFANLLRRAGTQAATVRDTLTAMEWRWLRRLPAAVLKAQRTVISICERMPELGIRFYERGPKRGS